MTGRLIHPASGHISLGVLFLTVVLHRVSLGTVYTLRAQVEGVTSRLIHPASGQSYHAKSAHRRVRQLPFATIRGFQRRWSA